MVTRRVSCFCSREMMSKLNYSCQMFDSFQNLKSARMFKPFNVINDEKDYKFGEIC